MLQIKRAKDNRVIKAILHRVADVPGGVTVKTSTLGGKALLEGTPLAQGANGLYEVVKTAVIVTEANATATAYEVAKGHHFKVGDKFATEASVGQNITNIDKSNAEKDVITLATTLGAIAKVGVVAFESKGADKVVKYDATCIAGSNYDVEPSDNLFVDAWVLAVVRKGNAPVINELIANKLKGVHYIA